MSSGREENSVLENRNCHVRPRGAMAWSRVLRQPHPPPTSQ